MAGARRSASGEDRHPLLAGGGDTLSNLIVRGIREDFFTRRLNPGDHIGTEASIAAAYDVSRMAARDAIRMLVAQGIVVVRKGAAGGVRIATGDPDLFADALAIQLRLLGVALPDLIEAQVATEAATAELAAQHADDADLALLRAALADGRAAAADPHGFADAMRRFHVALADASRNLALATMIRGVLRVLTDTYARNTTRERAEGVLHSYTMVTEAVAARDGESARILMRRQLRSASANLASAGVFADQGHAPDPGPAPSTEAPGAGRAEPARRRSLSAERP